MKYGKALLLSAGRMLTALSAVNAATPDALIQAHHQRCGKPVFYAQTANHKKEVEICIITPSVSYSFGKTGAEHKEMDISVPANTTTYAYQNNQVIRLQEFTVRNGDTSYQVSAGTNDEGKPFASLDVYQGTPELGKHLAEIRLDPDTVVNNISHALAQEGVAESDSL
ncbi:hypothetical protein [Klebsiella pneumoniae]|uniref:hypothetical protein n=1 Tax=Klebsiella pneumoniae TaxID=573 RepID=UPI001D18639C|nr:hypothetical protein [Klebsiella pneumoniae]CAE7135996.1 hypothetical protein AI2693V1_4448 [Klebsiella pneumoniae]CAH3947284.1 hypothetical protein AI2693V1_4448 [Klebsiella pneumoniae]